MSEDGIGSAVALLRTTFSLAASPVTLSSPSTSELAPDFADQSSFKEEKPSCSLQSPVSWKPSPEEVILQDQWPLFIWIHFFFFASSMHHCATAERPETQLCCCSFSYLLQVLHLVTMSKTSHRIKTRKSKISGSRPLLVHNSSC